MVEQSEDILTFDQEQERVKEGMTNLYTTKGDKKPLVLFGIRGPGGMNCLWPVIELLQKDKYPIDLLTDLAAEKILLQKNSGFNKREWESPLLRLLEIRPSVAVTEFSAGSGMAMSITDTEVSYRVPTIWVEDYPNIAASYTGDRKFPPTYFCAVYKESADLAQKLIPSLDNNHVFVTGHPDFDKYASIDREEKRREIREKLGLKKDDFLILNPGQFPEETTIILEHLIEALNRLDTHKSLVFLLTQHPRDTKSFDDYKEILNKFQGRVLEKGELSSDDVGFAADLLVVQNSTEGVKSCYRRVPSLHVLPEELFGKFEGDMIPFPVQVNASTGVFSFEDLLPALEKAVNNDEYRESQVRQMEKTFKLEGGAAEKIAEVIKKAANGQK